MIEKYKPTRAHIKLFLDRISERIKLNNENLGTLRQHEQRL